MGEECSIGTCRIIIKAIRVRALKYAERLYISSHPSDNNNNNIAPARNRDNPLEMAADEEKTPNPIITTVFI